MIRKILKALAVTGMVLILIIIVLFFFFIDAFGPIERTVDVKLENGQRLVCRETYNADFAAEFYEVDFKLIDGEQIYKLGSAMFLEKNWESRLKLYSIGDWYMLPVQDNSYLKILTKNKKNGIQNDTILSPHDLRYDSIWKSKGQEFATWVYTGTSELNGVNKSEIWVTFHYRLGDYEPFKFVRQNVKYQLDDSKGELLTKEVFEQENDR